MALSLNLTMNSSPNNNNGPEFPKLTHLNYKNNSTGTGSSSLSMPSPTSLLSKFYGLAFNGGSNLPLPVLPNYQQNNSQKYEGLNLNPAPLKAASSSSSSSNKTKSNGSQNHHPYFQTPSASNQTHLQLVDEIAARYPQEDYGLLRQALIRNEVTFTKLTARVPKSNFFPPAAPSTQHPRNGDSRPVSPQISPAGAQNKNNGPDIYSAQALELLRQQNEYVKFIQQSGINFSSLSPDLYNSSAAEGMKNKSKHQWLHPLAQAAAASMGYPMPGGTHLPVNGQKKAQPPQHNFASPKVPASNNSKPKTVAAALAASRLSPNSLLSSMTSMFEPVAPPSKRKAAGTSQRKRKPRQNKPSCTITRPPPPTAGDEDFLDPTSILEVTTSSGSEGTSGSINGGVDLTSGVSGGGNYSYLNGNHFMAPMLHSPNEGSSNMDSPSSKLKNYLEQFSNKSPEQEQASNINSAEPDLDLTKKMALEAFTYDPEVAGITFIICVSEFEHDFTPILILTTKSIFETKPYFLIFDQVTVVQWPGNLDSTSVLS